MRFRHLLQSKSAKGPSSASTITSFKYMPLKDDCIRIVYLQPRRAKRRAEEIECTLAHVAFGDRPEYQALSYAWGDGTTKRTILLDGINFEVGENLAAALVNIRGLESAGEEQQAIWIDAICINQSDLEERNRQVRLMPYIYARAQMVIVWLGIASTFKAHISSENDMCFKETPKHPRISSTRLSRPGLAGSLYEGNILSLCKRDYWKRLWIIQEIGKARFEGLRIHYDFTFIEWNPFIEMIRSREGLANSIPLKLDGQRQGRYEGGHTLSNLLRTNQVALCKDSRDKIYGFIGLAVDVYDPFPMDYSKSLFEVFTDTIFFLNGDLSRSQHDILDMSRLVGRMVGGRTGLEPDEPAKNFSAGDINSNSRPRSLRVPGCLVGRINEIGPLHCDLVANPEKLNDWISLIRRSVEDSQLRFTVQEQSEHFLEALRVFDEVSQRAIFAFDRTITWEEVKQDSIETFECHHGSNVGMAASEQLSLDSYRHGSRLFLLQPRPSEVAPSYMGLAPLGTQVGDFICHIAGIERAVIIRQSTSNNPSLDTGSNRYTYRIIGCAGLARDTVTARDVRGANLLPRELFAAGTFSPPSKVEHLNIYMDIHTAWEVSLFC